jgi:glutamyl-tRNA synthetase
MKVRTRFAPSPTGYLHIGGVRTALYAWLYAKKHQGQFVLRIEDTDTERSTQQATQVILDGLAWLGLTPDEGPYFQTQRLSRYQAILEQWLAEGKAYRCYCSKERLSDLRTTQLQQHQKPRYDSHCRNHTAQRLEQPYVIRFRNPTEGEVMVDDQVHGRVVFQNAELDDLVLARSDGMPTYNFSVVIDDMDMQISHVIRGDDHLNNTPRQINLLQALGAPIPHYAHLPMILGVDGKKLSKRQGAANVLAYREAGYLPQALLNYLVRLGWSHGDQEIFSLQEMIAFFDLDHLNKAPAAINAEKLDWLNQHYLKSVDPQQLVPLLGEKLQNLGLKIQAPHLPDLKEIILLQRERVKTLTEMAEKSRFFYEKPELVTKGLDKEILALPLKKLNTQFLALDPWSEEGIHAALQETVQHFSLKFGQLAQPLRTITMGPGVALPINTTLYLLGKNRVVEQINQFLTQQGVLAK